MSQGPVELRTALASDAAEIAELFADTCRHAYQGILPAAFLTRYVPAMQIPRWTRHLGSLPPGHRMTVACQEGRIVGFIEASSGRTAGKGRTVGNITVDDPSRMGEVDYLFVHPRNAGAGVGRLLLSAGEDCLATMGVYSAILWVFSDNTGARAFYEHAGWTFTRHEQLDPGLRKEGFSVRECLYRKLLIEAGPR